jgi:hypothetical protein
MWQDGVLEVGIEGWEQSIRMLGWLHMVLALAYLVAAAALMVCGDAARQNHQSVFGWFLGGGLLAMLGINTALNLDQLVLLTLREMARQEGWYGERRTLQFGLIAMGLTGSLVLLGWMRTRLDDVWDQCGHAVMGLALLSGLAMVRAVSLHDLDAFIQEPLADFPVGRWLEFAGLLLVGAGVRRWLTEH